MIFNFGLQVKYQMTDSNIRIYWRNVKLEIFKLETKYGYDIPTFVICSYVIKNCIRDISLLFEDKFYLNKMYRKIDLFRICTGNFGELTMSLFLL